MFSKKLLGGLSAAQFLRAHWQKKPLLIRGAFAPDFEPLSKREVLALAAREDAESRLIARRGRRWSLQHGPIAARDLAAVRGLPWTVLVQDTQHFSPAAHALLRNFDFVPRARVDDLMVSYAVAGGGVGAHLDSYDVFLLQGMGRRRWRIATRPDPRLLADAPVKILAKFRAEEEWVLEPGDMLYLPPGVAHEGVAESECLTWSIGFRAPSAAELSAAFLDFLRDRAPAAGEFRDPGLLPARQAALIDRKLSARLAALLRQTGQAARDPALQRQFLGCYLTEPKPQVIFDPPAKTLPASAFAAQARRRGIALDGKSRLLYDGQKMYLNGAPLPAALRRSPAWLRLAEARALSPAQLSAKIDAASLAALHEAYCAGYAQLGNP